MIAAKDGVRGDDCVQRWLLLHLPISRANGGERKDLGGGGVTGLFGLQRNRNSLLVPGLSWISVAFLGLIRIGALPRA